MTANEIIRKEYGNSPNFMTPNVIEVNKLNERYAYELSSGRGFEHDTIYGVSVVELKEDGSTIRRTDLSDCFGSFDEAQDHINNIEA